MSAMQWTVIIAGSLMALIVFSIPLALAGCGIGSLWRGKRVWGSLLLAAGLSLFACMGVFGLIAPVALAVILAPALVFWIGGRIADRRCPENGDTMRLCGFILVVLWDYGAFR